MNNGSNSGNENAATDMIRQQVYMSELSDNCIVRGVQGLIGGAVVGVIFGNLFVSFDHNPIDNPAAGAQAASTATATSTNTKMDMKSFFSSQRLNAVRKTLLEVGDSVAKRSWSGAKLCGVFGGVYAAAECASETYRAKHDIYNTVFAGCVAGSSMVQGGGVAARGFGCVSMAAFSAGMDKLMENKD